MSAILIDLLIVILLILANGLFAMSEMAVVSARKARLQQRANRGDARARAALRRVLLVVDGSPHSQCAVDYLAQFPIPATAEVRVMHVLPPLPQPNFARLARPIDPELFPPARPNTVRTTLPVRCCMQPGPAARATPTWTT